MKFYPNDILYTAIASGYLWPIGFVTHGGNLTRLDVGSRDRRRLAYEEALDAVETGQSPSFFDDQVFFRLATYSKGQEVLVRDAVVLGETGTGHAVAVLLPQEMTVDVSMSQPLGSARWPDLLPYEDFSGAQGREPPFDAMDPDEWERGTLLDGQRGWSGD